ncbi:MAG: 50S ribosomal protein L22 [Elusimicrobia bacterium]|nr:MAG: 50S ribosomal protein L22 [Elusimicrobiota bacterium]
MEAIAHARFQRYGYQKAALVLDQIRGKSLEKVNYILPQVRMKACTLVDKTIRSAVANLQVKAGKKLDSSAIYVTQAWVGMGPMGHMRRVRPAPMGRAMTIKKKVCHLTVVVSDTPNKKGKK